MTAVLIRGRRTSYAVTTAVVAVLGLSGCDGSEGGFGDGISSSSSEARILVASAAYTQANDDASERLGELSDAITRLREETTSGWTGRQDDETGYLAELTGGRWFGESPQDAVTSFMDSYGPELFGIDADDLALGEVSEPLESGSASMRLTQRVGDVPVLDAALTASIGAAESDPRVNALRGRVFPGLDVTTTPAVRAGKARRIAVRLSGGGSVQAPPELYVLPTGSGELAWEVPVMGVVREGGGLGDEQDGGELAGSVYYISAASGHLLSERPIATDLASLTPGLAAAPGRRIRVAPFRPGGAPAEGEVVEIHGTGPTGEALTSHGVRTPQGVQLVDTTLPGYDAATGRGTIDVYDMRGSMDDAALPGAPVVAAGPEVSDADAIAALAYTRMVHDYYLDTHGRASWDGQGHAMTSSINFGDETMCNAFFALEVAQMLYGPPCAGPGGLGKLVTLDVTGHEITHGVVGTTAGLIYFGQPGALNESFSDYFGNVIGDEHAGADSSVLSEDLCKDVTQPQRLCKTMPDGSLALRNLLNGTTFDDYLRMLAPSLKLELVADYDTDNGGVHLNSAIWNNALWSVRTQLAQIDGVAAIESARAATFDRAVYLALTTRLTPQSTFVDARNAVLESLTELQADSDVLRVATQTFDQAGICPGCAEAVPTPGITVDVQPGRQTGPAVSGDQVTWLDVDDEGLQGTATSARYDGTALSSATQGSALAVAFAGDAVITIDGQTSQVVRYAADGATVLGDVAPVDAAVRGLSGGEDGAAWYDYLTGQLQYVDAAGQLTSVPADSVGEILSVAAGGGTVAVGTKAGGVFRWRPGGALEQLGSVGGQVLSLAVHGDRTLAVTDGGQATLFEGTASRQLSDSAMPFGAAVSADHAVWAEQVGVLDGAIAEAFAGSPLTIDTDLFGLSFASGQIYDLLPLSGQQGYPALSGNRLVWQDSVLGDDDVFTAVLPDGL